MSKIAHTEKDVKKRREVFEENWKIFAGSLYNEEMIRNKIFTHIGYGSFGRYYGKLKNPLFGYENGSFVYAEDPLRKALGIVNGDQLHFKMTVSKSQKTLTGYEGDFQLKKYNNRKDTWCYVCLINYQDIQMEIERWSLDGDLYGMFLINPCTYMSCGIMKVHESKFNVVDIPRMLKDMWQEYSLREEELKFQIKRLKLFNMHTAIFDESHVTSSNKPRKCMQDMENYLLLMKNRYRDPISTNDKNLTERDKFVDFCKKNVNVEFKIVRSVRIVGPRGSRLLSCLNINMRTESFFVVDGCVLQIEEFYYSDHPTMNKCIIYPFSRHPRYSFTLHGLLGCHALVGLLKQLPELCRQIDVNKKK